MRTVNAVRCLSMHAAYRCRDSGACCTAGWPIPVEADRLAQLEGALASGELRPVGHVAAAAPVQWLARAPRDTPAVLAVMGGACVFYRAARMEAAISRVTSGDHGRHRAPPRWLTP
jgi:hypothetical protein